MFATLHVWYRLRGSLTTVTGQSDSGLDLGLHYTALLQIRLVLDIDNYCKSQSISLVHQLIDSLRLIIGILMPLIDQAFILQMKLALISFLF